MPATSDTSAIPPLPQGLDYDYIIIGSGFGGSVSALRLSQKGYRVLVVEKGKWFRPQDFPRTNWNLPRWLWLPRLGWRGLFKITVFRHATIYSGVGVGGGSLVYANTLPIPKDDFFNAPTWAHLAQWQTELAPHYRTARQMLGAAPYPYEHEGDCALHEIGRQIGKEASYGPTTVAVYTGQPGVEVQDPYFDGKGPTRTGCIQCGACMLGCPHNAKNTLDKNYLHLAQQHGAQILASTRATDVKPLNGTDGSTGYRVYLRRQGALLGGRSQLTAGGVIFAGGVLGTMGLLLRIHRRSLPRISARLGSGVRTNNESLLGAVTFDRSKVLSEGAAITSILQTDDHSHLEVVRYNSGSGFFRLAVVPAVYGSNAAIRIWRMMKELARHPLDYLRAYTVDDLGKRSNILLFMQTLDSTLRLKRDPLGGLTSVVDSGPPPTPFIPEAYDLAQRFAKAIRGKSFATAAETFFGIPSTAHILGGACMGATPDEGVIDASHRVHGYHHLMVVDGSAISANPGVNPSLTITALAERAMSLVPEKDS